MSAAPSSQTVTPSRWRLAVTGFVAGAAGLCLASAGAWLLGARTGPVHAVGATLRDIMPGNIATWLLERTGELGKPLLITGILVVTLLVYVVAGLWSRRRPLRADLIFVVMAAIGLIASWVQDFAGVAVAVSVVAGLVTQIAVLRWLTRALSLSAARGAAEAASDDEAKTAMKYVGRRGFVLRSVGTLAVSGVVLGGGWVIAGKQRAVDKARRLLRLPTTNPTPPAGARVDVPGIGRWKSAADSFYLINTELTPPAISPDQWELRIHGMVDRELRLSYDDLISRKLTEDWVTLCCVSNPVGGDLVGNAWWSGILVRDLLREAGVHKGADAVLQTAEGGWTCVTPLTALTDERNALLAVAMNGRPLPVEHGFPVRTVVPGLYGYVSATKWLTDLKATTFAEAEGYWTSRGWSPRGPIKTMSRIDVPAAGADVPAGALAVGGVAWAQHTGITRVEYSVDGGGWQRAKLGRVPNDDTWVQWSGLVNVSAGEHTLAVRATDKAGYTQTAVKRDVLPNGATGWHTIDFNVQA